MPKLIIIHGPTCVGKSTLSHGVFKKLKGFAFVDRAYIKSMLRPCGNPGAKNVIRKATHLMVRELMKLKKDILIQEQSRSSLKLIIDRYGKDYEIISFFLTSDLKTSIQRAKSREKKFWGSKKITAMHERIKPEPKDIIIDTKKNSISKCINIVLKKS
jgi:predicted ABC-type ATPase